LLWTVKREEGSTTLRKYHLPQKFALVANQFWRHKNHRILPPALGLLKRRGIDLNIVVTGLPSDYRDPENASLSEFFQESAKEGVMKSIHFLGKIPYGDLVEIMRSAALIIQPSFFEGWSTSIEDSKALGRPLICSDIQVHREQVPDALGFFDPKEPAVLAELLAEIYGDLLPGPDLQKEDAAFALARQRAFDYGARLLEMTWEAANLDQAERLRELEPLVEKTEQQRKLIEELEAHRSDLNSELSRLRKWNRYLRRQSLAGFVSRNIRSRLRLGRKRTIYLRQKQRHAKFLIGKLKFKATHFRPSEIVPLPRVSRPPNVFHPLANRIQGWLAKHLGDLEQYPPRILRNEIYPPFNGALDHLPSMTIVTPSYNQGEFLGETIESVLSQDYPRLQYAVVDGGSSDGSREILENYRSQLAYAVSEPDDGQAHAIVKGFANTHGEIMAYLNSDDCLMPGALRFIGHYFQQHPEVDVIYGHRVIIRADGLEIGRWIIPPHDAECVRRFDYIPQETLFWRRRCYEAVGGIDVRFHFALDWDLILKLMKAGAKFRRLPYFLACFRVHGAQKTSVMLDTTGEDEVNVLLEREFPQGNHQRTSWFYLDRYRLVSACCRSLLKWGIRV
jgi:Glycosyl transferase family 2/Glycosyl transferases group 1